MQKLQSTEYLQPSLLDQYNPERLKRRERLMKTIDNLNKKYGRNTLSWASSNLGQEWSARTDELSQAATTRITDIPIVKA